MTNKAIPYRLYFVDSFNGNEKKKKKKEKKNRTLEIVTRE